MICLEISLLCFLWHTKMGLMACNLLSCSIHYYDVTLVMMSLGYLIKGGVECAKEVADAFLNQTCGNSRP